VIVGNVAAAIAEDFAANARIGFGSGISHGGGAKEVFRRKDWRQITDVFFLCALSAGAFALSAADFAFTAALATGAFGAGFATATAAFALGFAAALASANAAV
jgi:hypothetical protein